MIDVYKRHYNKKNPVVGMDETPKHLIKKVSKPLLMRFGSETKLEYEYSRCGVCNIFMINDPLAGNRYMKVTQTRTQKKTERCWFGKYLINLIKRL